MALITPQAARCDGLWLSVHTDDRNRYYCWGCIRFCRSSLACRTCSLSRHSNYCWHFRGCCQLSFFLFLFFVLHFLSIVTGLCSEQKQFVLFDSTWHEFFLSVCLSVFRFFLFWLAESWFSDPLLTRYSGIDLIYWVGLGNPIRLLIPSSVAQSFLLVDQSPSNMKNEEVATCQEQHWTLGTISKEANM